MNLLIKYYEYGGLNEGGIPDEVLKAANENPIVIQWQEFACDSAESTDMKKVFCHGYSLASEKRKVS